MKRRVRHKWDGSQIMRSSGLVGTRLLFDLVNTGAGLSCWVTKHSISKYINNCFITHVDMPP